MSTEQVHGVVGNTAGKYASICFCIWQHVTGTTPLWDVMSHLSGSHRLHAWQMEAAAVVPKTAGTCVSVSCASNMTYWDYVSRYHDLIWIAYQQRAFRMQHRE